MKDGKATVVWLMNSLAPYRASICGRIAREVPAVRLIAAVTHDPREGNRWPAVPQDLVPHVLFSPHEMPGPQTFAGQFRGLGKAARVLRWLRKTNPDALVVTGYDDVTRLLAVVWGRAAGKPVCLTADSNIKGDNARGLRGAVKHIYLRWLLRRVWAAFPFGEMGIRYFRRYGMPAERIYRFPLEPDYDLIDTINAPGADAAARAAAVADRLKLAPGRRRLIYSGRLVPAKRVDLLIDAFGRIAHSRPQWDLVILGDGPERTALQTLADQQGGGADHEMGGADGQTVSADRQTVSADRRGGGRIRFVPALVEQADVFAAYRACEVLVLPSDYEPWALVVNEAAAAGMAIVCSDVVGAAADLLRDGENGRSFPAGDPAALANALLDVTDEANLPRYQAASRKVLADWRREADPVAGFKQALTAAGVIAG